MTNFFEENILELDISDQDYHYFKYRTRINNCFLITSKLVGKYYFNEDNFTETIIKKGTVLFMINFLENEYMYISKKNIKIKKKYRQNRDIVDYNSPIILVEEFDEQ